MSRVKFTWSNPAKSDAAVFVVPVIPPWRTTKQELSADQGSSMNPSPEKLQMSEVPEPTVGDTITYDGKTSFQLPHSVVKQTDEVKSNAASPGYELKTTLEGHDRYISSVKFSHMGNWLASSASHSLVKLWDVGTANFLMNLHGHEKGVNDMGWSAHDNLLSTCSDDKTIKLWDRRFGRHVKSLDGHESSVLSCCFSPQSNLIVSSSDDCTVRLWDVRSGRNLKSIMAHRDPITSVDFNGIVGLFATGSYDGLVRIWSTVTCQVQQSLVDKDLAPVGQIKFSPNGRYLLVSYMNSEIRLWNFYKQKCLRIYSGHVNLRYCIAVNFSVTGGMWIVAGSEDNHIYIWDLKGKNIVQRIPAHGKEVIATDCHPKLNLIASGALEAKNNLKLWQSN